MEELHQPGPSGGQLDVVELAPIHERHQEVDSKRPRMGLLDRGDAVGQGNQTRVLQHAQTTGSTDRDGQLRGARAAEGSLLDWHLSADQLGKGRRQHGRSIAKLRSWHSTAAPPSKTTPEGSKVRPACVARVITAIDAHANPEPEADMLNAYWGSRKPTAIRSRTSPGPSGSSGCITPVLQSRRRPSLRATAGTLPG